MARSTWFSCAMKVTLLVAAHIFVAVRAQAPEQAEWLAAHNAARSSEGAGLPSLTWNTAAYQYALAWARDRAATPGCPFDHSPQEGRPYGENLAWSSSTSSTPASVVTLWMSEKPNWDFASKRCTAGMCGHYTQVVWKATTSIGCASVPVPAWNCNGFVGGEFSICSYYPPGNYLETNPY